MPPKSKAAAAAAEPVAVEDLFTSIHRHIEAGAFEQAAKVADQVLNAAPGDEDAVRCKVVAYIKADEIDKALAVICAAERLPIDLSYYKLRGPCSKPKVAEEEIAVPKDGLGSIQEDPSTDMR